MAMFCKLQESSPSIMLATSQGGAAQTLAGTADKAFKVTLLASEWGSSMGGLSTINRTFAISLARHPQVEVTFLVPEIACGEEDKRDARRHNIAIRESQSRPGYEPLDRNTKEYINFKGYCVKRMHRSNNTSLPLNELGCCA